jgi:hypothetical protein
MGITFVVQGIGSGFDGSGGTIGPLTVIPTLFSVNRH